MPGSPFKRALLCCLIALSAACSTPISPYSQFDDESEEDEVEGDPSPSSGDAGRSLDAGPSNTRDSGSFPVARDAGSPSSRDAGSPIPRDAGSSTVRDAGSSGQRDAGSARDAGAGSPNCMRIPTANFANLLSEGCAQRPQLSCSGSNQTQQQVINDRLTVLAEGCGAPAGATIGVTFGGDGCPALLGYEGGGARNVFSCLQAVLDNTRIGCSLTCALIGPGATR